MLTNKLYVGSHKGNINDGYVCSSKHMLKEYKERSTDFKRQIIAEGNYLEIKKLEQIILTTVNAAKNKDFYNLHNGGNNFGGRSEPHTLETKQKISFSKIGEKNPNWKGKSVTEKTRIKMSESHKGDKNVSKTEEVKKKLSIQTNAAIKNGTHNSQIQWYCTTCDKFGKGSPNIARYHKKCAVKIKEYFL